MKVYVPYTGKTPSSILVKGHKLVIVFQNGIAAGQKSAAKRLLGADKIKKFADADSEFEFHDAIERLTEEVNANIVVAPENATIEEVVEGLEHSLPWIH